MFETTHFSINMRTNMSFSIKCRIDQNCISHILCISINSDHQIVSINLDHCTLLTILFVIIYQHFLICFKCLHRSHLFEAKFQIVRSIYQYLNVKLPGLIILCMFVHVLLWLHPTDRTPGGLELPQHTRAVLVQFVQQYSHLGYRGVAEHREGSR